MAVEGASCSRCELGYLEVDEVEGFLLCASCGFVADDNQLQHAVQQGGEFTGVIVSSTDDGTGAAAIHNTQMGWHGRQAEDSAAVGRARVMSKAVDHMESAASTLKLPAATVTEATQLLREVRASKLSHIGGAGNSAAAQVAAVLYLAARRAGLPLLLTDAASALQVNLANVRNMYLVIVQAMNIALPPPSSSIRALVLKLTAALAELHPSLSPDQGSHIAEVAAASNQPLRGRFTFNPSGADQLPGTGPHGSSQQQSSGGNASEPVLTDLVDIRKLPTVRKALLLAELVTKLGLGEGRPPRTIAAAVLFMALVDEQLPSKKSQSKPKDVATMVASHAPCTRQSLLEARRLIEEQLLQVAVLLPVGAALSPANLMAYLPLLNSLVHTLVMMKRAADAKKPAPSLPALAPPQPAPSAAKAGTSSTAQGGSAPAQNEVVGNDTAAAAAPPPSLVHDAVAGQTPTLQKDADKGSNRGAGRSRKVDPSGLRGKLAGMVGRPGKKTRTS